MTSWGKDPNFQEKNQHQQDNTQEKTHREHSAPLSTAPLRTRRAGDALVTWILLLIAPRRAPCRVRGYPLADPHSVQELLVC